jgi:hypothetical protein
MVDVRRGSVRHQLERDFPFLPAGCTLDLDRQSREIVLENLKAAAQRSRWTTLVSDATGEADDVTLHQFLERSGHRIADVYRRGRSWTQLRRDAGKLVPDAVEPRLSRDRSGRSVGLPTSTIPSGSPSTERFWRRTDRPTFARSTSGSGVS